MADCRGCGSPIAPTGRRGRPRAWCSPECRPAPEPRLPKVSDRRIDMAGQRFGTLVVVEPAPPRNWLCVCDCGQTRLVRRRELLRFGDRNSCGARDGHKRIHARADIVSYLGAHDRCRRDRGPARDHQCVDCGGPALHWSYDHTDPDELMGTQGTKGTTPYPYSLDPAHYSPRCASCHARFDAARGRPHYVGSTP